MFLVNNLDDVNKVASQIPVSELMVQEFIPAEYEYKVITVGYKALPVVLKIPMDLKNHKPDFEKVTILSTPVCHPDRPRASRLQAVSRGGAEGSLYYNLRDSSGDMAGPRNDTLKNLIGLAEQSSRVLGRELAKVDILE